MPTFKELGLGGVVATGWFGFFAPAKTPGPIIDALNRAINNALKSPDVVAKLSGIGMDPVTKTPDEFALIVVQDYSKWGSDREGVGIYVGLAVKPRRSIEHEVLPFQPPRYGESRQ